MPARAAGPGEFEARLAAPDGDRVFARLQVGALRVEGEDGRPRREIHLDDVREVARHGTRVTLDLDRGAPLVLHCERAEALDAAVVIACCTIPELTRALRSLGSSRLSAGGAAQREFFAPLLDARRRAEESVGRTAIVRAFDPDRLGRALDSYLGGLAGRSGDPRPAARRAFTAQVEEAADPLRAALDRVRRVAGAAAEPSGDRRVSSWRAWAAALHDLFDAADRCWRSLHTVAGAGQPPKG